MKNNKILASIILGLSLIVFGFILKSGIVRYIDKDRQVTVKGLSEREVPANLITWTLATYVTGNDLPSLYKEIQKTNNTVVEFLKGNGLTEKEITILPPEVDDRVSNRYSNEYIPFNYKLTTTISITSSNVDLVKDIVMKQGELLSKGIALGSYNYIKYDYTGFQDLKQEMIEEAIGNAKTTATQFVSNYGSRLGKIITADQGQFSINSKEDNPSVMKIRGVATITYAID
jgi:hypothetical protein